MLHAFLTRFIITCTKAALKRQQEWGPDSIQKLIHQSQKYLHYELESIKFGETGDDFLLNFAISHRPIFQD